MMDVKVNGQTLYTLNFSKTTASTKAVASEKTATIENSAETIEISVTYDNGGNPSASAFLDFIEILGKKQLVAADNQFY